MNKLISTIRSFDRRVARGRLFLARNGVIGERYRTIQKMAEKPVLIGGCGRSGTTLLLSLLSAHPDIYAVPEETGALCPTAYSANEDLKAAFRIEVLYSHLSDGAVPLEDYERWCEKSPKNVLFAERLLRYFGKQAKFINVVRDGRDVVTSRHPTDPDKYWVSPERWVRDVSAGKKLEDESRVMTVRYEDLVSDDMELLRRICNFLGERFPKKAFRSYPESSQFKQSRAWSGKAREISDRSVGRWKGEEHREVVSRLYATEGAKELLEYYGYLNCE